MNPSLWTYFLYLIRWQLSTPILSIVISFLSNMNPWISATIANFIGGLIFYWVDLFIFQSKYNSPLWEVKTKEVCFDCKKENKTVFRLVKTKNYNKMKDENPEFRCVECSNKKLQELREKGILV